MHKPFSFGVRVKPNVPTNKPINIASSFDEEATASIVNLGIKSFQTETNSKADKYSRESGGRTQG